MGFTRVSTFEGQAAMWVERLARNSPWVDPYAFPCTGAELDFRPLLENIVQDRLYGREVSEIARAFQRGVAVGLHTAVINLCDTCVGTPDIDTIVLSGGVFQNELLLSDLKNLFLPDHLQLWTNHSVPGNDGGISLGQAAVAAFCHSG